MNDFLKNPSKRNALIVGILCLTIFALGAYRVYSSYYLGQIQQMNKLQREIDALWPPPDEGILPSKQSVTSNWAQAITQLSQQHQTYWSEKLNHLAQTLGNKIWLEGATFRTGSDQKLDVEEVWRVAPTTGLLLEGRIDSPLTKQQLDEVGTYLLTTLNDPVLNVRWQLLNLERIDKKTLAFTVLNQ